MNRKQFIGLGLSTLGLPVLSRLEGAGLSAISQRLIEYGQMNYGRKIGDGTSLAFITAAVKYAHAKPGNLTNAPYYTWGSVIVATGYKAPSKAPLVNDCMKVLPQMGTIVQFGNCSFAGATAPKFPNHTAIVANVTGYTAILLHQGFNDKTTVQQTSLDFSTLTTPTGKGKYTFFVPQAA